METSDYAALGLVAPEHRNPIPEGPQTLSELLEKAMEKAPGQTALSSADEHYSYAQLDAAVNNACRFFMEQGIRPGDRVAASMKNCCDIVIAFLAVQRLGAVWVGINAILPIGDKTFILAHSEARLLLADNAIAGEIAQQQGELPALVAIHTIEPESAWRQALQQAGSPPDIAKPDAFAPAAIMYTSGTTGTPKGVVHSQHNMLVVCAAFSSAGVLSPHARRGSVLPLTITNVMILGPVMAFWNATSFVCGTTAKTLPMIDWIRKEGIQTFSAVPTMVYDILQADVDLPDDLHMGSGGAPLPEPVRQAFARRYGKNLLQSYGLTEAPTVVTESRGLVVPEGASGKAADHLDVTIRDKEGRECPAGTVGEICIAATRQGRWVDVYTPPLGYWKDLAKSTALLEGGVVHTGDFGRFDEEGWLYVADRGSELILRGGSNVYPAEIERVLHMHDQVSDCAVVGKPDERLGNLTVAFIITKPGTDAGQLQSDLKQLCADKLVRYKCPDEWRFVEQFPRNAMGKIVKPKLREQLVAESQA